MSYSEGKNAQQELYNPAMRDLKENAVTAGLVLALGEFEEQTPTTPRSFGRIKTLETPRQLRSTIEFVNKC